MPGQGRAVIEPISLREDAHLPLPKIIQAKSYYRWLRSREVRDKKNTRI